MPSVPVPRIFLGVRPCKSAFCDVHTVSRTLFFPDIQHASKLRRGDCLDSVWFAHFQPSTEYIEIEVGGLGFEDATQVDVEPPC